MENNSYEIIDDYIWKNEVTDGAQIKKKIGKEIKIITKERSMETGNVELVLEIEGHEVRVPRWILDESKIKELLNKGADITNKNKKDMSNYLNIQEGKCKTINTYNGMGWGNINDSKYYKHDNIIGENLEGMYTGNFVIQPKGSKEIWFKMVREKVVGYTPMEFGVVLGLTAVLVGYIGDKVGLRSMLVQISGDSTTGKTTVAECAVSTAGLPSMRNGLIVNWNTTSNAIVSILNNNYGIPFVLDESSISNIKDFSPLIYSICEGKEKLRLDNNSNIKDISNWQTVVISTGEHSLLEKSKQNTGVKVRISEFENIEWTESAEHADSIKRVIRENYGHAAPIFAEKLIALGESKVIEKFYKCKEDYLSRTKISEKFRDRISLKNAMFLTTALLVKELLDLEIDYDKILEFLLENEKGLYDIIDIGKVAYDIFLEEMNLYINNFIIAYEKDAREPRGQVWGRITEKKYKDYNYEVSILPQKFKDIMEKRGFSEPEIILKRWKELNILSCEDNKNTRRRKVVSKGAQVKVYVIRY